MTMKSFINVICNVFFIALHTLADFSGGNRKDPKAILFWVSFCFTLSHAMAGPIDPKSVLQVAQEFVQTSPSAKKAPKRGGTTLHSDIVYTHKMPQNDRAAFYIVNVDDAFVLVSADDVAYQVLGYNFDKNFPIAADGTVHLPPHVKGFFDDLARQIEAAADAESNRALPNNGTGTRKASSRRSSSNLPEKVDPLLTTTWDQGQFYNSLCPEDADGPDGHVVTGCIATVMAQIINYWGSPIHGRGMHSYNSNYGTLEVNFANSIYDFNNMPDGLTAESTEEQIHAVAKLMYDCGVAVNMQYSAFDSEAFDIEARAALINYFYFSPDMSFAQKDNFGDTEWNELLCENLAANRPVLYSGQGTGGHSFVCDGYKADDYFHFNFGWGGLADGWYLTSAIEPSGEYFSSSQSAIVGIVPDNNGNVIIGQMQGTSSFTVDEPLEFFHLLGHNAYMGSDYNNPCNNTVSFISADDEKQLVVDIMEFENQSVSIYDGPYSNDWIRDLSGGNENDLSPVVSTQNGVTLNYSGQLSYAGFKFRVSQEGEYRMVSNIVTSVDNTTVHLAWTENGAATQWQIEYGLKGFKLGEGTVCNTNTNSATIENLEKFTEYDFYIRSVYGSNQYSPWNKVTLMVAPPYWQDVVTSQPEGYVEDSEGNVEIYSAEGLSWLSSVVVNGCTFEGKTVTLMNDINLESYRMRPIGNHWYSFSGIFDGGNYTISNTYISDDGLEDVGLFSMTISATLKNIRLLNGKTINKSSAYLAGTGGLVGCALDTKIINCHSTLNISGITCCGSLCGNVRGSSTVTNCSAKGNVEGRDMCGGLIGITRDYTKVSNCYSTEGVINSNGICGGLIGYNEGGSVYNCYSNNVINSVSRIKGKVIGAIPWDYEIHYLYVQDNINPELPIIGNFPDLATDVFQFHHDGVINTLLTTVSIDGVPYDDLLEALNAYVTQQKDQTLRTWILDANTSFPAFGDYFEPSCYFPTDLMASQATVVGDNTIRTQLSWSQIGEPASWEVLYVTANQSIDKGVIIPVTSNPCELTDIPTGRPLDFYVRAVNSENDKSRWSDRITYTPDKLFWVDVVTEQPDGYIIDEVNQETHIYTAEGLAWYSRAGAIGTIYLESDIDMSQYKWSPIYDCYYVNFNGKGHVINGLNGSNGLFGSLWYGTISNIHLTNVNVFGESEIGAIAGMVWWSSFYNCSAQGTVGAVFSAGGLVGNSLLSQMKNSFFVGTIEDCQDIPSTLPHGYSGGLVGNADGSILENNYFSGNISALDFNGLLTAIGTDPQVVKYCYALNDSEELPFTVGDVSSNLSYFTGSGNNWTLTTSPGINGVFYTDLVEALNAWVDANNTEGQYRHWVADTGGENGGFPIFAPRYTLTYMVDGVKYKSYEIEYGATITPEAEPTKEGYTFSGWSEIPATMPAHDVTVTGTFSINTYKLTYLVDGEEYKTYELEYGAAITPEPEPVKNGYQFSGWSEIPETMPAHDVTVTGTFELHFNVGHVVNVLNFIMGGNATPEDMALYDMNHDGVLNIGDVILIVRNILDHGGSLLPAPRNITNVMTDLTRYTAAQFELKTGNANVKNIRLVENMEQSHRLMYRQIDANTYAVVIYSQSNELLRPDNDDIIVVETEGDSSAAMAIRNITAATPTGETASYKGLQVATGIQQIESIESTAVSYDLKGHRLNGSRKGINIINGKKTVVR